eukprot:gene10127-2292_t
MGHKHKNIEKWLMRKHLLLVETIIREQKNRRRFWKQQMEPVEDCLCVKPTALSQAARHATPYPATLPTQPRYPLPSHATPYPATLPTQPRYLPSDPEPQPAAHNQLQQHNTHTAARNLAAVLLIAHGTMRARLRIERLRVRVPSGVAVTTKSLLQQGRSLFLFILLTIATNDSSTITGTTICKHLYICICAVANDHDHNHDEGDG